MVEHLSKACTAPMRWVAVCVALAFAGAAGAQSKPVATSAPVVATATDRQKAAHADADRLVSLAEAMKTSIDKSRKDELNVQVIRDAEEIEKLARSLRSRIQ